MVMPYVWKLVKILSSDFFILLYNFKTIININYDLFRWGIVLIKKLRLFIQF